MNINITTLMTSFTTLLAATTIFAQRGGDAPTYKMTIIAAENTNITAGSGFSNLLGDLNNNGETVRNLPNANGTFSVAHRYSPITGLQAIQTNLNPLGTSAANINDSGNVLLDIIPNAVGAWAQPYFYSQNTTALQPINGPYYPDNLTNNNLVLAMNPQNGFAKTVFDISHPAAIRPFTTIAPTPTYLNDINTRFAVSIDAKLYTINTAAGTVTFNSDLSGVLLANQPTKLLNDTNSDIVAKQNVNGVPTVGVLSGSRFRPLNALNNFDPNFRPADVHGNSNGEIVATQYFYGANSTPVAVYYGKGKSTPVALIERVANRLTGDQLVGALDVNEKGQVLVQLKRGDIGFSAILTPTSGKSLAVGGEFRP